MNKIKEKILKFKKEIIVVSSAVLVIVIIIGLCLNNDEPKEVKTATAIVKENNVKEEQIKKEDPLIAVDIKGEVANPGVYLVNDSLRVNDVIILAGGLTKNADNRVINLAKKVFDEMVIIVYSKEETNKMVEVLSEDETKNKECLNYQGVINNDACIEVPDNELVSAKININTSSKEELMTLSGIGESKALNIIKYRQKEGLFTSIEDIMNVTGIGESVFAKIKDFITI